MPYKNVFTPKQMVHSLRRKIARSVYTPAQAHQIAQEIANTDWVQVFQEIYDGLYGRSCDRVCVLCNAAFRVGNYCVPACKKCNSRKSTHHLDWVQVFPSEAVERVRSFINQFS